MDRPPNEYRPAGVLAGLIGLVIVFLCLTTSHGTIKSLADSFPIPDTGKTTSTPTPALLPSVTSDVKQTKVVEAQQNKKIAAANATMTALPIKQTQEESDRHNQATRQAQEEQITGAVINQVQRNAQATATAQAEQNNRQEQIINIYAAIPNVILILAAGIAGALIIIAAGLVIRSCLEKQRNVIELQLRLLEQQNLAAQNRAKPAGPQKTTTARTPIRPNPIPITGSGRPNGSRQEMLRPTDLTKDEEIRSLSWYK